MHSKIIKIACKGINIFILSQNVHAINYFFDIANFNENLVENSPKIKIETTTTTTHLYCNVLITSLVSPLKVGFQT
jgi:hypothetical protein